MKVYMLCDMEGVSGLLTREIAWYWEAPANRPARAEAARLLTADINAACAAALAGGVDELVVCDTHHDGDNVLWDELLADPRIAYETPGGLGNLMPGLDGSYDGVILLGHHAKAGTLGAFLDHTMSSRWFEFQISGQSVGEIGIEACFAAHWGVPVVMVQGDESACAEAAALLPGVVTAPVKRGIIRERAAGPAPEVARRLTAGKVAEAIAVARAGTCQPYRPQLPLTARLTLVTTDLADAFAQRPGVRRLDARTLEYEASRYCDVVSWLQN